MPIFLLQFIITLRTVSLNCAQVAQTPSSGQYWAHSLSVENEGQSVASS